MYNKVIHSLYRDTYTAYFSDISETPGVFSEYKICVRKCWCFFEDKESECGIITEKSGIRQISNHLMHTLGLEFQSTYETNERQVNKYFKRLNRMILLESDKTKNDNQRANT